MNLWIRYCVLFKYLHSFQICQFYNFGFQITENVIKLDLKVFVYNGVHFDGYIHPHFFNDYDVVIISISNLLRDLNINKIMVSKVLNIMLHILKYYII